MLVYKGLSVILQDGLHIKHKWSTFGVILSFNLNQIFFYLIKLKRNKINNLWYPTKRYKRLTFHKRIEKS